MRRADRLFRLIELLRGRRRAVTGAELATTLEVSLRTVYRDVADLIASGVPIDGEAGVGYRLAPHYHLPPLTFDAEEIEAIVLGAAIVASWTDAELAQAARRITAKVQAVLPPDLRDQLEETALYAPRPARQERWSVDLAAIRRAIRERRKVRIGYLSLGDETTERTVRPLGLVFFGPVWLLVTWCDLRNDFRSFRVDRITDAELLPERFPATPGKRIADFMAREGTRPGA